MPGGRPSQTRRTSFGEKLFRLREAKGLSQKEIAEKMKVTQQAYAAWERRPTSLKPQQLVLISTILETSIDELLGIEQKATSKGGPVGKLQKVLGEASQLPRHQQNKIAEVVKGMMLYHETTNS